jgi:hypothetical protein
MAFKLMDIKRKGAVINESISCMREFIMKICLQRQYFFLKKVIIQQQS